MKKAFILSGLLGIAFAQEVSFRQLLPLGYDFVSLSDTQTLVVKDKGGMFPEHIMDICSKYGGKAYVVNQRLEEAFGGRRVVEEKIPVEERTGLGGFLKGFFKGENVTAPGFVCEKDGKEILRVSQGGKIGRLYPAVGGGDVLCYAQIVTHPPEPNISSIERRYGPKAMESKSLIDYLRSLGIKVKQLSDGSYSFDEISYTGECYPIISAQVLAQISAYCYAKGGVFKANTGEDYREFMGNIMMRTLSGGASWLRSVSDRLYYCDGPEKFMVYIQRTNWNIQSASMWYKYQIKEGLDQNLIPKFQLRAEVREPSEIEKLVIQTVETQKPQISLVGNVRYQSLYLYKVGDISYVAVIIEGPGYKNIQNYEVYRGRVNYLGESADFGLFTIDKLKEDTTFARGFFNTCRGYGQASSNYRNYRIDCRVPNPAQACFAEVYITRDKKLIDYALGLNICQ